MFKNLIQSSFKLFSQFKIGKYFKMGTSEAQLMRMQIKEQHEPDTPDPNVEVIQFESY